MLLQRRLCAAQRCEHCCCQTVVRREDCGGFVCGVELSSTPLELTVSLGVSLKLPQNQSRKKSACEIRFLFQPIPWQALTEKSPGL